MIFYHSNWHGSCFLSVYCKLVLSNKPLIPDRSGCFLEIFSEQIIFSKENTDELFYVWSSNSGRILALKKEENFKSLKCGELFPYQEANCMESSLLIYTMFYIEQGGQDI